jgi:hypothetical protein
LLVILDRRIIMRPGLIFGGLFILAAGLVFYAVLLLAVPIVPLVGALLLGWAGVRLMRGSWRNRGEEGGQVVAFGVGNLSTAGELRAPRHLAVLCGKGLLDLTDLHAAESVELKLEIAFGVAIVRFDPHVALRVDVRALGASCTTPDGTTAAFGRASYGSPRYRAQGPAIILDVVVMVGALRFTPGLRSELRVPAPGRAAVFEPESSAPM